MSCKLGQLLADPDLPAEDRALLEGWCESGTDRHGRRVPADALALALHASGHRVGPTTVKDHRAGRCCCHR